MTTEEKIEKYVHLLHDSVGANNTATHQELTNPSNVVIDNFKTLSFACSGTIDVIINGVTVQYPKTLGSSTVLGETLSCDKENRYPVTFNGTGTVLITKQSRS
jgi:hypothetical protein